MASFHVVDVQDDTPWMQDGRPAIYPDGLTAGQAAANLYRNLGRKFKPKKLPATTEAELSWRKREQARFDDGTYKKLPWDGQNWWNIKRYYSKEYVGKEIPFPFEDHFAHPALGKEATIAFTESDEKGQEDVQSRMSPGKYLQRFCGHILSSGHITELATNFGAAYDEIEVLFANSATKIEWVYRHGPKSCMSESKGSYRSPCHPTHAYAGPDLAIAYLMRDGKVTARTLCWPDKKIYTRVYGDRARLEKGLSRLGYSQNDGSGFMGARLKRIMSSTNYVLPYIDYIGRLRDDGEHLIIDNDKGDLSAGSTNGLVAPPPTYPCHICHERSRNNLVTAYAAGGTTVRVCRTCRDAHVTNCDYHHVPVLHEHTVQMYNGHTWSTFAFNEYGFTCPGNGKRYPRSHGVRMTRAGAGPWSQDHFKTHGYRCCGRNYPKTVTCSLCGGEKGKDK